MKKSIEVTGMHCGHCAAAVENALLSLAGVKKAKANHEANEAVRAAVESAGFTCGKITEKKGLFG